MEHTEILALFTFELLLVKASSNQGSTHMEHVGLVLDALKRVLVGAALAHLEEA